VRTKEIDHLEVKERTIRMTQTQLEHPPLTFGELSELLSRHVENAAIAKVIKDAMQRRLAELGPATSS
jgi:hypothetical protein